MRQKQTGQTEKRKEVTIKFKFKAINISVEVMARLNKKQQQDKRELLSSLNHVNNCIGSKHAVDNRKYCFLCVELFVCGSEMICGVIALSFK